MRIGFNTIKESTATLNIMLKVRGSSTRVKLRQTSSGSGYFVDLADESGEKSQQSGPDGTSTREVYAFLCGMITALHLGKNQ